MKTKGKTLSYFIVGTRKAIIVY